MSDLEIIDQLRTVVSQIDRDAPPGLVWLRSEILALVGSPRVRRCVRNQLIRELAGHYATSAALAAAISDYAGRCWAREQHLGSSPEGASEERQLLWRIFAIGLDVPCTRQGIDLVLAEVPCNTNVVAPCSTPELASILEAQEHELAADLEAISQAKG